VATDVTFVSVALSIHAMGIEAGLTVDLRCQWRQRVGSIGWDAQLSDAVGAIGTPARRGVAHAGSGTLKTGTRSHNDSRNPTRYGERLSGDG